MSVYLPFLFSGGYISLENDLKFDYGKGAVDTSLHFSGPTKRTMRTVPLPLSRFFKYTTWSWM